jgi:hypothetical protein
VRADGGAALKVRAPAVQQAAQPLTNFLQIFKFVADEQADVGTRRAALAFDGDDVLDRSQREAKPTRDG